MGEDTSVEIASGESSCIGNVTVAQTRGNSGQGILRIGVFFSILGLIAFGLDAGITHGLRTIRTSKFGALNKVIDGQANAEIVISGSSRALCHYDPRIVQEHTGKSAYNIGMNASQIDFQLAVLKTYLKHNTRPKLVIQNLDLFSLETTRKGELYDPGYYLPYLYENELYEPLLKVEPEMWKSKYLPLYGYAVADMRFTWVWGILGCLGINSREDYFSGFNPRDQRWNEDFRQFQAAHAQGVSYSILPEGVAALEEMIRLCQSKGTKIVLIYSPEYSEAQALTLNRAEIFEVFQNLTAKFSVDFFDYSGSSIAKERTFFYNSQHLNRQGSQSFSADVATKLTTVLNAPMALR